MQHFGYTCQIQISGVATLNDDSTTDLDRLTVDPTDVGGPFMAQARQGVLHVMVSAQVCSVPKTRKRSTVDLLEQS